MNRFNLQSFSQGVLAGAVFVAILAALSIRQSQAGWQRTIENHKKLERILMDRIELRDQQDTARAHETATVKTVLLEDAHQGVNRAAWTIPGRVVPATDDGRLGAYYGYLDSTGHLDGWHSAARDEAPNVLPATLAPTLPPPAMSGASSPCPAGGFALSPQQIMEVLKAAKGARP